MAVRIVHRSDYGNGDTKNVATILTNYPHLYMLSMRNTAPSCARFKVRWKSRIATFFYINRNGIDNIKYSLP